MLQKDIYSSKPDLENLANQILYSYISKRVPFNLPVNTNTFVNEGYAGNVHIYSIIRKIVDPTVGVKWWVKDLNRDDTATDNTLQLLLDNPNSHQSRNEFIDEAICWRLVTGNRYIYWLAPENGINRGKPAELHLLPASLTEITQGDWLDPVGGYRLLIGKVYEVLPKEQVIHGKKTSLQFSATGAQLYGQSPLQAAMKVMAATNTGYDRLNLNFLNGGPDVIITNAEPDATEWTEAQKQSVYERFKQFFGKNKERWAFFNKPKQVHEIGKSPVDLNILEYFKMSIRDYCNIYNVPPALMDPGSATISASMREFQRQLWNNAVIPELEYMREDLNKLAGIYNKITNQNLSYEYDLSDIPELQTDYATQYRGLDAAWWLTPNERLVAMGLPESDDPLMNVRYVPMGLVPMDEMSIPVNPEDVKKWYDATGNKY